jgi:hypothetical protein
MKVDFHLEEFPSDLLALSEGLGGVVETDDG